MDKKNAIYPAASIALLLALWEASVLLFDVPSYVFPSFSKVLSTFGSEFGVLCKHGLTTALEASIGIALAAALAFALAILMDMFAWIRKSIYPLLVVTQTIPIIVLTPIFIIYFGFGMLPKIITVVLMCFFPMAISFADGLAKADEDILNLFKLYQASRLQIYRYMKIPAAMDSFFSGMKVAATYCISGAVVGEWISSDSGLGYYMLRVKNSGALDKVFACVLFIIALSLIMNGIVKILQRLYAAGKRRV